MNKIKVVTLHFGNYSSTFRVEGNWVDLGKYKTRSVDAGFENKFIVQSSTTRGMLEVKFCLE